MNGCEEKKRRQKPPFFISVFGGIVAFVATYTMETRRCLFLLYNRKSAFGQ